MTLGAVLPYWRLLTLRVVFVTDDYFASDIFNGELPGRVLIGQLLRQGHWPVWTTQLCSGLPLAGVPLDALGLAAFALLPPAAALDVYLLVLLLIAAHGAYSLARRVGADTIGAVLSGIAFAGCGYFAAQLKHVAIVATVAWLPVGLVLIDRVLAPEDDTHAGRLPSRMLATALFAVVFSQQVLAGFPQSAYICGLVYGAFALVRAIGSRHLLGHPRRWQMLLAGLAVAVALAALTGAVLLLPLSQLGSITDRAEPLGYDWSTILAYWPPNLMTFVVPYAFGDISNNTYIGPPFFWEDYGYLGVATFLLALYAVRRDWRRPLVLFMAAMTGLAMLFVLGRATPVYHLAYLVLPGLKMFRFPTRFLIVVDLGLAVLGGVGLTRMRGEMERLAPGSALPRAIAIAICAATALDLLYHQPRQNPMVPGSAWLAPPPAVDVVRADTPQPRTFTPRHRDFHRLAFQRARGWSNVEPYFALRDVLEPNVGGGYWSIPSADCYAGISARWSVDVWGDHNRNASIAAMIAAVDANGRVLRTHPVFANVLRTFGVTHVLSPFPLSAPGMALVREDPNAYIYRVAGTARARFVRGARPVSTEREAVGRLMDKAFDPDAEIILHDAPASIGPLAGAASAPPETPGTGTASVTRDDTTEVVVDVDAPADGFLLLADTYYPGWSASVDGAPVPIYRANLSVRGIQVPKGRHQARFEYELPGLRTGAKVSTAAGAALLLWVAGAAYAARPRGSASVAAV